MPIESTKTTEFYIPSLALQRAWDNPVEAEFHLVVLSERSKSSNRGRLLCATINSILVLANLYLIMENLL